jgi:hypothetical protein
MGEQRTRQGYTLFRKGSDNGSMGDELDERSEKERCVTTKGDIDEGKNEGNLNKL